MLRLCFALVLAAGLVAMSKEEQDAEWRKAMEESARTGQPAPILTRPRSDDRPSESRRSEQAAEAERLRQEQERLRTERETREKTTAEERARREAIAVAQWNERQRQQAEEERLARESAAAQERVRLEEAAIQAEEQRKREAWGMVLGAIGVAVALVVAFLPSIIASIRGAPQQPAIVGLVLCTIVFGIAAGYRTTMLPAPALLWSSALVLSLWRRSAA